MRAKNRDLQFPVSQELDGPICMLSFNIILALLWLYLVFDKDGGDKKRESEQGNEHTTVCVSASQVGTELETHGIFASVVYAQIRERERVGTWSWPSNHLLQHY